MAKRPPISPKGFDEAIKFFRSRVAISDADFNKLKASAKRRAFRIAGIADVDLVQSVLDDIERSVRDGTGFGAFKKRVRVKLLRAWGKANPHRIEAMWRTEAQRAFTAGRYRQLTGQAARNLRPFWIFDAVLDSRTSAICSAHDGTVRRIDNDYWKTNYPPLHINCRSSVRALRRGDARRNAARGRKGAFDSVGQTKRLPRTKPAEGFGRAPVPDEFEEPDPDLSGVDSSIASDFRKKHP